MQKHGFVLGLKEPFMLHALLAFTACHLSHLSPKEAKWAVAFTTHYSVALSAYRTQIKPGADRQKTEQILGCCFLVEMMIYWNASRKPTESPTEIDLLKDSTWMRSLGGIPLLKNSPQLFPHVDNCIWKPVFDEAQCATSIGFNQNLGKQWCPLTTSHIIILLESLCESPLHHESEINHYQGPLNSLRRVLMANSGRIKIAFFMRWIGTLPSEFTHLLETRDTRALLILGCWTAYFSCIDQWWIKSTATSLYQQIRHHVVISTDSGVLKLQKMLDEIVQTVSDDYGLACF
jgi:hypothetical protein